MRNDFVNNKQTLHLINHIEKLLNCYPCSINFSHQITNLQSYSFRYAKDLDDNLVVSSVLFVSLSITLLTVILSVLSSFTQVYSWVFF